MTYTELFPALIRKNLITTKPPPIAPNNNSPWYKADQFCAYHQGSSGHNIENFFPLKTDVKRLINNGILSFKDVNPNVRDNPLPRHGAASVNMVEGCPGKF